MSNSWKATKAQIIKFLNTNSGKQLNQSSAHGAIVFNPSDYCPYSDECLAFKCLARGDSGRKGVESHLRKVHRDVIFYLVPCSFKEFIDYTDEYPDVAKDITTGIKKGRLKFCPAVSSPEDAASTEQRLKRLFAEKRHRDTCERFLDPAISSQSRNVNHHDMQATLMALTDTWTRSSASDLARSAKPDATRARMHAISILENNWGGQRSFETIASQVPALRNERGV